MTDPQNEPDLPPAVADILGTLRDNAGWLMTLGIVWLVCGAVAILFPLAAALAIDVLIGILLLVGGAAQIVHSLRCVDWAPKILQALIGLLSLVAGLLLLVHPWQGVVTLTLVLSLFFLIGGVARAAVALQNRGAGGWGWLLASGVVGIIVGVLIWAGLPGTAVWAIGLMVGIELMFSGLTMIMLARAAKKAG